MDTIKKGKLGYNILEKELLKRNWDIYLPILEDTKIDCIISKQNYWIKMQIKTLWYNKQEGKKYLPVRKINHNQGGYKVHRYTSNEIDYFVGVDIETEDVYIVPINFSSKYATQIGIKTLEPYKNNFTQLEPQIGNDLSGCDDIGETLTGNTEGIK